jgi:hypothetical protein
VDTPVQMDMEFGSFVENPLRSSSGSGMAKQKSRHAVLPEFDESDGNLAQAAESEDLYDVINDWFRDRGLIDRGKYPGAEQSEQRVAAIFKDIKDWDAPIEKPQLKRMLETSMQIEVTDALIGNLFQQIDRSVDSPRGAAVSAREFTEWYTLQEQLTQEMTGELDPHQAQLKRMKSQGFIIDPNSNFRGNWDIVQAVLLSEAHLGSRAPFL